MRRTDLDIKREDKAREFNEKLRRTNVKVEAWKYGPYSIVINYLNEKEVKKLLPQILKIIEET